MGPPCGRRDGADRSDAGSCAGNTRAARRGRRPRGAGSTASACSGSVPGSRMNARSCASGRYSTTLCGTFSSGPTRPPSPLMAWHWRQLRAEDREAARRRGARRRARRHGVREAIFDAHHGDLGELVRPRVAHDVALAGALPDHVERRGIGLPVVDRDRSRPRAIGVGEGDVAARLEQHAAVARARVAVERAQQHVLRRRSPAPSAPRPRSSTQRSGQARKRFARRSTGSSTATVSAWQASPSSAADDGARLGAGAARSGAPAPPPEPRGRARRAHSAARTQYVPGAPGTMWPAVNAPSTA